MSVQNGKSLEYNQWTLESWKAEDYDLGGREFHQDASVDLTLRNEYSVTSAELTPEEALELASALVTAANEAVAPAEETNQEEN